MGRVGSGPEFHVNFGSDRVGSLHVARVGSGQKIIIPTSNSGPNIVLAIEAAHLVV